MLITFDINTNIGLTTSKSVAIEVCDIQATGEEMQFAADLTSAVKDFATNYNSPKKDEQGGVK